MSYLDKQINNILINETIKTAAAEFAVGAFTRLSQGVMAPIFAITSSVNKQAMIEAIEVMSGWYDLRIIGIFDTAKLDKIIFGAGDFFSNMSTSTILGYKTIQACYLSFIGVLGFKTSEKVYDSLSQNKNLVQKSTDVVNAVESGDVDTVVGIASEVKHDDTSGMITPDSLDNTKVVEVLDNSNPIFSKAREIALEYPKLYVPIILLTIIGLVYLKMKKNK